MLGALINQSLVHVLVQRATRDSFEHTVNSHINRLRAKLEPDPTRPQYVLTVWGVGYRLCTPEPRITAS